MTLMVAILVAGPAIKKTKAALNEKNSELKKSAKKFYDVINNSNFKFSKRAKENNELYGSVKPTEISKLILEFNKIEIKPSMIQLVKEIKSLGNFKVKINLHPEVQAEINIKVESLENNQ